MPLRDAAIANLNARIEQGGAAGSTRLFSVRHEFPSAWAAFKRSPPPGGPIPRAALTLDLKPEHYPFWSIGRLGDQTRRVDLFARTTKNNVSVHDTPTDVAGTKKDDLHKDGSIGGLCAGPLTVTRPKTTGSFTLYFDDSSITDLWIAANWGKS